MATKKKLSQEYREELAHELYYAVFDVVDRIKSKRWSHISRSEFNSVLSYALKAVKTSFK
jgi:hypothetical protein